MCSHLKLNSQTSRELGDQIEIGTLTLGQEVDNEPFQYQGPHKTPHLHIRHFLPQFLHLFWGNSGN